jgi:hypothetical protein
MASPTFDADNSPKTNGSTRAKPVQPIAWPAYFVVGLYWLWPPSLSTKLPMPSSISSVAQLVSAIRSQLTANVSTPPRRTKEQSDAQAVSSHYHPENQTRRARWLKWLPLLAENAPHRLHYCPATPIWFAQNVLACSVDSSPVHAGSNPVPLPPARE